MRKISTAILFAALLVSGYLTAPAQAGDWMFRRSYYSHAQDTDNVPRDYPRSRSAYREPFVGAHPRFAIRGGWRVNNMVLQNGSSTDRTFFRENWFDTNY